MLDLAPPPFIDVAARTGYQRVGVRLLPAAPGGVAYRLMDDAGLLQDTVARIRDTGVGVFELEMVRLDSGFRASDYLPFFEVGEKLGAKTILVAGDDADEARLTASYAALCEAAAPFGLAADIEFMPWTKIPDARSALRIVTAAAQPNGGVLVDALHVARSATSLADIAAIPPERLHYAQICDGPAEVPLSVEAMIHTARCERLLPGEGGIDLIGLFATLPADLPICVEIPNVKRAPVLGNEEWARQALAATKATLARIEARDRAR
jgi:sugar phosphate isomerase/epimerase